MKELCDSTQDLQGESAVSALAARVAPIFDEYPMLCGFSVEARSALTADHATVPLQAGLCLADVTVITPPGFCLARELCNEIAGALLELMDEQPEVIALLPGRTFARTLH
jgi:hypothetical protein